MGGAARFLSLTVCPDPRAPPPFLRPAALYVAKDHSLTREVIPGLLKYWPFGNSQKQIMFINELEDLFEYVQVRASCAFIGRRCLYSVK